MFDLDPGKMLLFGAIALVVVPPKDLPVVLRAAGRALARLRRMRDQIRGAADELMADPKLDRELASIRAAASIDLARNPMTAMRGRIATPVAASPAEASGYVTPEMQAYLAPPESVETQAAS